MTHDDKKKELEYAFEVAQREYDKTLRSPYVKYPVAYALYKAWRWADAKAKKEEKALKFERTDDEYSTISPLSNILLILYVLLNDGQWSSANSRHKI